MLTERQQQLIEKCKRAGFGWRKFAESIEAQGWCSPKQEDTLCLMTQKIDHALAVKNGNFRNSGGEPSISDYEAMRGHDYF